MLKNYLLTALRHFSRHKTWAITNLAGLSIGLACVLLILLFVKDEISFDRFQANGPRLYRLVHEAMDPTGTEEKGGTSGAPQAQAFLQSIPGVEAACRITGGGLLVKKGSDILPETALYADTNFFRVFSFSVPSGNAALALNREDDIVLSADMARKYFNTTDAVGKTLRINAGEKFETFTVSAVAADAPLNSSIRFDFILPIARLVLIAFVIASPVAWYVYHRWLQDFAYRITLSWNIFFAVGALMTAIALLTTGFRAVRTAMMNPVRSLRTE